MGLCRGHYCIHTIIAGLVNVGTLGQCTKSAKAQVPAKKWTWQGN